MLLWINGPFGGGKTVTAFELRRRLDGAVVCDPERVGFGLQRTIPPALRVDFQTLRSWRSGVVEVLDLTLRSHPGPVVVPMTLVEPAYFEDVIGGLRGLGHDVRHYALLTEPAEVVRRLRQRTLGGLKPQPWALQQVDRCLDALVRPEFAVHVDTTGRTVGEVAREIAADAGLEVTGEDDRAVRGWLRRTATSARHIRMDWRD